VAITAGVGQLILFHHDPSYSDAVVEGMEVSAKKKFTEVRAAYEGLEILLQTTNKITKKLQSPSPQPIAQKERGQ
jgi:ribonuclease BN (tRNA processing enzyme)